MTRETTLKSCGKRHSHCSVCRPEISVAISAAMMGNQNGLDYKHTNKARAAISAARRDKPSWNKGTSNGDKVSCPQHPYANKNGVVRRSRIVWEFTHYMFLPRCFQVHHINHIHRDNRPENLAPMFKSEHMRWHRWEGV